jgi:cohesin complex subunit SCC1
MSWAKGNVDRPANELAQMNRNQLILADAATELDLFGPLPDPEDLLKGLDSLASPGKGLTIAAWDDSSQIPSTMDSVRSNERRSYNRPSENIDDLDLGLDIEGDDLLDLNGDTSIEKFRDAPAPRRASDEFGDATKDGFGDDLGIDLGGDDDTILPIPDVPNTTLGGDDVEMTDAPTVGDKPVDQQNEGREDSPLSEIAEAQERDLAQSLNENVNTSLFEPADEEPVVQARQVKRRRLLQPDADTELRNSDIRALQNDRSKILKPAVFLPRDPLLLTLLQAQKNGEFVSNILGDGRSRGWAPELRSIISLEVVRRSGDLKRKRDKGIPITDEDLAPVAEIILPEEEEEGTPGRGASVRFDETVVAEDGTIHELPGEDGLVLGDDDTRLLSPARDDFDDTTVPILHPADSGPISVNTKHAVHLLRERFGSAAEESAAERQRTAVVFQDMMPEKTTSRAEATKMFFEVLVLATKDAVKVDQSSNKLGGPIRVRAKRGLWGAWAEMSAGGEIASQMAPEGTAPVAAG